jgi:hypothetical protein
VTPWSARRWLSESGLLTTKVPSREGQEGTATLDGLRAGDAGEPIPLENVKVDDMYTNVALPKHAHGAAA